MNSPYTRVYHAIADDPKFSLVYGDDRALGAWLRMLLVADAMYPTSAPMPARTKAVKLLIEVGLIVEQPGNRYVVKGLASEREKRSQSGRNAAAVRWHSGPNASRDETRQDEQGLRNVPVHDGRHPDCLVCAPMRKAL